MPLDDTPGLALLHSFGSLAVYTWVAWELSRPVCASEGESTARAAGVDQQAPTFGMRVCCMVVIADSESVLADASTSGAQSDNVYLSRDESVRTVVVCAACPAAMQRNTPW